jgi:hypothetical protein
MIGAFTALAVWSSVPLTIQLLFTFRSYGGLYFWAILTTTWGLNVRAIGLLLKYTVPTTPWIVPGLLQELGWVGMVSGFSVILYSRLSILVQNKRILWFVLAMIVTDGVCLHISTIAVNFGTASQPKTDPGKHARWVAGSNTIERIQAIWFTVQEQIIAGLYIKAAWDHIQDRALSNHRTKRVMLCLIAVQTLVSVIDIVVVVLECTGYFVAKLIITSFVYSIKLQLEFVVLNQLVSMSRLSALEPMVVLTEAESRIPDSSGTTLPSPMFSLNEHSTERPQMVQGHALL